MLKIVYRMMAKQAIQVKNGHAIAKKGIIRGHACSDISEVFRKQGLKTGEIWIAKDGKITFSRDVPKGIRQRLRNVVASR